MRLVRRLLVVAVVALAVPALAVASSSPIVAAAKRTAAAKSTTLTVQVTTSVSGQPVVSLSGTGVQRGTDVKMSMRVKTPNGNATLDAILVQEAGAYVMYMRSPLLTAQLPKGKSWIRIDLSKQGAKLGLDFSSLINSSQTLAPLEAGLVSTTRVGSERIVGTSTTRYRAVVDIHRAARAVPAYGQQVTVLEHSTGLHFGNVPYDVWVAGDGRIRRMHFSMPTASAGIRGRSSQTITYVAFDKPVTIEAPPRSQVVSAP
jgi:hypothetical protein